MATLCQCESDEEVNPAHDPNLQGTRDQMQPYIFTII